MCLYSNQLIIYTFYLSIIKNKIKILLKPPPPKKKNPEEKYFGTPSLHQLFSRNDPFCLPIFGFWFELWSIYMRLVTSGSKKYRQQNQTYHSSVAMSYNSVSSDGIYWLMDVVAIDE